jgi:peptide chain release factor 1
VILEEKLERVVARLAELSSLVAEHPDPGSNGYSDMLKELADLTPVVERIEELRRVRGELNDVEDLLGDPESDKDLRTLAASERQSLQARIPELEHELKLLLLPKDEADERNAILEVRAGTGGEEAALFAAELFRMYQRYAEQNGWRFEPINISETGIGGYKEASAAIAGKGVFARLKFESGPHRVQRVPATESGGRIHTSAATVAVLPEAEEVDVQIDEKDLRIDTFRAQGAGGQHVNKTDSAVRITMKVLRARLYERQREEMDAERAATRRAQVGSGDRSEKIRTYNFPQGRVTDHRISLTLYKLDRVLAGEALDELIESLIAEDQAARLAALQ